MSILQSFILGQMDMAFRRRFNEVSGRLWYAARSQLEDPHGHNSCEEPETILFGIGDTKVVCNDDSYVYSDDSLYHVSIAI